MSNKNKIIEAFNENLRVIYRKAVDADAALNKLQASGKGKFNTIFGEGSGFDANSKRFGPYVEELAGDVAVLLEADEDEFTAKIPVVVKKLETLLSTLEQFKHSVK